MLGCKVFLWATWNSEFDPEISLLQMDQHVISVASLSFLTDMRMLLLRSQVHQRAAELDTLFA